MASDNDLSVLIPSPPPPRSARREAAIEEALRRFDGGSEHAPLHATGARSRPALKWWRPQAAALASIALVVTISLPIWWLQRDQIGEVIPRTTSGDSSPVSARSPASPPMRPAALNTVPPEAEANPVQSGPAGPPLPRADAMAPPAPVADIAPAQAVQASEAPARRAPPPGPPPPPPAPRQPAARVAAEQNIVVTGSRVARPEFNSSSPVVSVDETLLESSSSDCNGNSRTCRANAQLEEGIALAREGNTDRAIDAFGRAIRIDPDLSAAYLNRGLAYQTKGDLGRALRDLHRAIDADPDNAPNYYYRSLIHRARGTTQRGEADARRAAELNN